MLDILSLKDNQLIQLIENRWSSSNTLWAEVETTYKKNKAIWESDDSTVATIPRRKSKVRDNRAFLAMESVVSNLTGRPSKPNVLPGNESPESGQVATDLQDLFLEKYRVLGIKGKMRKGLRWLLLSKLIVLKNIWNNEIDDYDLKVVDPRKVRFNKKATGAYETDFAIEEIDTTMNEMLDKFPDKTDEILKQMGGKKKEVDARINNVAVVYKEAWIGDWVIYKFREMILKKELNPYWDWDGVFFTKDEMRKFQTGKNRKKYLGDARKVREERAKTADKYQQYLFNHFDKPMHPYIFASMLGVEDRTIGETSLMGQIRPLQTNINQRKRQIANNAASANGRWKIDTKFAESKTAGEWQAMKSDPEGIIIGDGVRDGVTIESGRDLPSLVREDLVMSIQALDAIFGTQPTFRGEKQGAETATGRAILREQSFQRLIEVVDIIDGLHSEIYNWQLQFIKTRYTESHYTKLLGRETAMRVIEIMQDSIEDGIEVKVIPGQIMPKDRVYRTERALEGVKNGFITPLTYFEEAEFDNPMETAKQLEMYKISPFAVLDMDDDDIEKLRKGIGLLKEMVQSAQPTDERATEIAELRKRTKEVVESPEFKKKSPEEQQNILSKLKLQFKNLTSAKPAEKK